MRKQSGRGPSHVDPEKVFETALCFEQASRLLYHVATQKLTKSTQQTVVLPTMVPAMANEALSLEIYLKCLWALDHADMRISGHMLYNELFVNLSNVRQAEVEALYDEEANADDIFLHMRQQHPNKSFSLIDSLKEADAGFVEWRYIYEGVNSSPHGLKLAIRAVRRLILTIKPEWVRYLKTHQI